MKEKFKRSGIDTIGDLPWGTHICQFYKTKEDLTDILIPFFKVGLENNEFCLWITSQPLEVEEATEALRRAIPDLDSYLDRGQIEIISYTCLHVTGSICDAEMVINYWIEKLNHALESGHNGLRLSGNTSWLGKKDWDYFVDYMGKMDDITDKYRMIALGSYLVDKYSTTEIIEIVCNHQFSLSKKEGKWERTDNFGRKKAEEAAFRAVKDWERTFNAVPDLIAIIDTKYQIVRANRAIAAKLRLTPEECVGLTCYRVIHGTSEPPPFCPHQQLLNDGLEHTAEIREECLGGYFIVSTSPLYDSKRKIIGSIYVGHDINERKRTEEALRHSEQRVRLKLESILSPDMELANLELADIVDIQAIQSLMDDFYKLAHIPMSIDDLKDNVLLGVGWQDICTKFHRVNPETCKHCVASGTKLFADAPPGEFKIYKCKNNMWHISTPIMVGGQHVGNIFSGQFFFEEEPLDYEFFRFQARKYGFNEEEYIAALEKVPRLSMEVVDTGMSFFIKLANMISQLSFSNIKLAQSLAERDTLVDALRESGERERARSDELTVVLDAVPAAVWITQDSQALQMTGNRLSYEWLRLPEDANVSKFASEGERPETYKMFKDGVEIPLADMPVRMAAAGKEVRDYEFDLIYPDGTMRHLLGNARPLRDEQGNPRGSISAFIDITERKKTEEALRLSNIYNRGLIEASLDPQVTIGLDGKITDVNGATEQVTGYSRSELIGTDFSDYFTEPEKARAGYQQVFTDGEIRDYSLEIQHKGGHITPVLYNASVYRDENGEVIGIFAAARDITELKKAEKASKESEIRFRTLAENSPDIITRFDRQHRHVYANPAAVESYDISLEEIIGKTQVGLGRDPKKAKIWDEHQEKTFVTGKTETMEYQYISRQGKKYYFNTKMVPEFVDGKVTSVLAISRDITDFKKAEAKLKKTLDNLDKLVKERTTELQSAYDSLKKTKTDLDEAQEMAHIGSWEWDIAADKAYWSDELYRIYRRDPQELAPPYNEYLGYIHPADRDYFDNATKRAIKGRPYSIEYRIVLANGEERTVHMKSEVIFDEKNIPIRIKGIIQDITENKRAEENIRILANIVESSQDSIVTISLDGIISSWNRGAEQIYGYSAEEIIGKNASILAPDNLKGEIKKLIDRIKQEIKIKNYETTRLKKDGTLINVSLTLSPIFNAPGKLTAISVIARDITERIKAEKSLVKVEDARKKEIHHRIKNNLQVISSLLDLQAGKFNDPKVIEAFRESQSRVISMALIHEELYKGEGTVTLNFSEYLKTLAENLFQTYRLSSKNIHLNMDLEENAFFDMDIAVPLGIIVNELLSNSLKHAFPGRDRGEIRIKLRREGNVEYNVEGCRSTSYTLTVSDNGVGIPENLDIEDLDSLGLQLVTSLVDQLDGELDLKRNNGTEFTMRFKITEKQPSSPAHNN